MRRRTSGRSASSAGGGAHPAGGRRRRCSAAAARSCCSPLRGWVDAKAVAAYPHYWIAVGQFGRFRRLARAEGCRDLVLVGGLVRPPRSARCASTGRTLVEMPRIVRAFRGGDDHLLTGIGRIFESDGFRLLGAHEVAPDITAPAGALGLHQPDADGRTATSRAASRCSTP